VGCDHARRAESIRRSDGALPHLPPRPRESQESRRFGGGISRYDRATGSFTNFTPDPDDPTALSSPRVTSFAQDLTGALWVGTDGGGLNLLDPTTGLFHHFNHDPRVATSLSSNTIYALHVDAAGTVWIGNRGGGLDRVEGTSQDPEAIVFRSYSTNDGLANSDVYGIQSDGQGQLWLSSNGGLTRLNPRFGTVKSFSRSHGLQANEFNFGAHFRSSSGELFFGGVNGFNSFFPTNLEQNPHAPEVALTSFLVNNLPADVDTPTSQLSDIELGYRDDVVTFEFAALDFADPEANQFAYMLEGFDADWTLADNIHRVTYTNLDAGNYVFRVKAANSDGVWNHNGLSLGVGVAPPPWKTWWAYTLYSLALLMVGFAFVRSQQRKVEREAEYSRRLEGEVDQRTTELRDRNAELKAVNRQLLEASLTDSLTGLRNRRFLFEQVAKDISLVRRRYYEVAAGKQQPEIFDLVFMMVDLDHFKSINDNFGHAAGDQVLLEIRDLLLEACRASDVVIRWGGDEFLVVGRDADPQKAAVVAERIRTAIESKIFTLADGQIVRTTCSVGFACYPFVRSQPDTVTWEQVLQFADSALYAAKEARNAWVGYQSTATTLLNDGVVRLIREAPEQLVIDGDLKMISSSTVQAPAASGEAEAASA
jgi:diguanylate cyclase (GGDEF)-like protein